MERLFPPTSIPSHTSTQFETGPGTAGEESTKDLDIHVMWSEQDRKWVLKELEKYGPGTTLRFNFTPGAKLSRRPPGILEVTSLELFSQSSLTTTFKAVIRAATGSATGTLKRGDTILIKLIDKSVIPLDILTHIDADTLFENELNAYNALQEAGLTGEVVPQFFGHITRKAEDESGSGKEVMVKGFAIQFIEGMVVYDAIARDPTFLPRNKLQEVIDEVILAAKKIWDAGILLDDVQLCNVKVYKDVQNSYHAVWFDFGTAILRRGMKDAVWAQMTAAPLKALAAGIEKAKRESMV